MSFPTDSIFLRFCVACYAVQAALIAGFALHTDTGSDLVFGKYSSGHLLLLIFLVAPVPFLPAFLKALLRPAERTLPDGRNVVITLRKKLVCLGLVTFAVFLIIESVLQISSSLRPSNRPPDYLIGFHPHLQIVPSVLTYDGINSAGFRGHEIQKQKPEGAYRIFCLGGSTTFNPFLKMEESYPRQLEKLLKQKHPAVRIEVQNAGMSYYTSQHSLINFLTRVQDYQPDLVVVCHAINDLCRSFTPPKFALSGYGYRPDYSHYLGPQGDLFLDLSAQREPTIVDASFVLRGVTRFVTSRFFSDLRFKQSEMAHWEVTEFPSLETYQQRLEALCSAASLKGTSLIVATQPYLYREDLNDQEKALLNFPRDHANDGTRQASITSMIRGMNLFNGAARTIARAKKVQLADLEIKIEKSLVNFTDDVHYTPEGARQVAEAIAGGIEAAGEIGKRIGAR